MIPASRHRDGGGQRQPIIDSQIASADTRKAMDGVACGPARGKVVICVERVGLGTSGAGVASVSSPTVPIALLLQVFEQRLDVR